MKQGFVLIFLWFGLLTGCAQPAPAEIVPNGEATSRVTQTQPPIVSPEPTLTATITPFLTDTQIQITPRWIGPTPTALQVTIMPEECVVSPGPEGQEFEVREVGSTKCLLWADAFDNETGFRVVLQFGYNGEMFVYETPANRSGMPYPAILSAPLSRSFEYCMTHKDYMLDIYALLPDQEPRLITGFSPALECNRFGMPSATPSSP